MKIINNGELRIKNVGDKVTLFGWVANKRKMGGMLFLDLRDRWGITQIIVKDFNETIMKESVIKVVGEVVKRKDVNDKNPTGEIEVVTSDVTILSVAKTPPFVIKDDAEAKEDLRLEYRYLDLRKPKMTSNLVLRHKVIKYIRDFLDKEGFIEIETPLLSKSTPEGARDFLVPTRNKKKFFALPQSPQLYKQMLMASGIEKYFQVARAFRDEDSRSDRQPEFTQLDIEASFTDEEQIISLIERMYKEVFGRLDIEIKIPFNRISYADSMEKYGNDKPHINKEAEFDFNWVIDWPLYEENEDGSKTAMHHPFTQPSKEDAGNFDTNIKSGSRAYDLALNGYEIGGGSIRISDKEQQIKMFKSVGLNDQQINDQFGFFLKAFDYGLPPHGGIAFGIDRLLMILAKEESIREVIAFPKNAKGKAVLENSPSNVTDEQLSEYHIKLK
ncbi:MAG: hypothetical protein KAG04_01725 [Mycoplasmataceae bacterium]|nr:hypothetical protein [Mycoplasmataceae bacterium]